MRQLGIIFLTLLVGLFYNTAHAGSDLNFRPTPPDNNEGNTPNPEPPLIPTMCERLVTYRDKNTGEVLQELVPVPDIHVGDVHITASGDHIEYLCIRKIIGDLVLDDNFVRTIQWPRLEVVTGDATITYDQNFYFDSSDNPTNRTEVINLENLHRVGGSLKILSPYNRFVQEAGVSIDTYFDFGLPSLQSIGNDLSLTISCFSSILDGLPALEGISGNFFYDDCSSYTRHVNFLANFSWIGGNADITLGNYGQSDMFEALAVVDGNLTITDGLFYGYNFTNLTQVLGVLALNNIAIDEYHRVVFPNLDYAGHFKWNGLWTEDTLVLGGSTLMLGGLTLTRMNWNNNLETFLGQTDMIQTAPIKITDNPNVSECEAWEWVDSLPDHTGKVEIHSNRPC